MKSSYSKFILPAIFIFTLGGMLGMALDGRTEHIDPVDSLRKIEDTFTLIYQQYVDEVEPEKLAESAILSMLQELDPHSIYIDAENVRKVQDEYQGAFGGIGIWFEVPANDTARVTSTIPDGPGESVGIMAGDRMVAVDGESIVGVASLDIQNQIKGPEGSQVKLTVMRPGVDKPIDFLITRAIIPLYSVDASFMMDDETGYVRIGRFALTTPDEFREKVRELRGEGMRRLVIDLRGNPGGVKRAAVDVADEMLAGEGVIVSTRGRSRRQNEIDRITRGGLLTTEPVIVLVDESSASGSEIVAGALQDHDRALIVGRRTFGKGLVQQPFQLDDGSVVQMTVARYYMPSGRSIQTHYETGVLEDYYKEKFADYDKAVLDPQSYLSDIPDSLKFETLHGRIVFGGGGVMPDVVVAPDSTNPLNGALVQTLLRRGTLFLFARDLVDGDPALRGTWDERRDDFIEGFNVSDGLWNDFISYANDNDVTFDASSSTPADGHFTEAELADAESVLRTVLKARIAQRLFRADAWYPIFNSIDPAIQAVVDLWSSAETLSAFHDPSATPRGGG